MESTVDFCCQIMLLFKLELPHNCHDIWAFILGYFYDCLNSRTISLSTSVTEFCSTLEKISAKNKQFNRI